MAAGRFGYRRLQGLNFVQRQNKKSGKIHLFNLTFLHFYYEPMQYLCLKYSGKAFETFFIISKNVINFSKKFTIRHYLFIHVQHIDNLYMEEDYLYGH